MRAESLSNLPSGHSVCEMFQLIVSSSIMQWVGFSNLCVCVFVCLCPCVLVCEREIVHVRETLRSGQGHEVSYLVRSCWG